MQYFAAHLQTTIYLQDMVRRMVWKPHGRLARKMFEESGWE